MAIKVDSGWEDIINYVGLKDHHLELLHGQKSYFEKYSNMVVANFYSRLLKNEWLPNIVAEHSTFDRLTKIQRIYFNHLFSRNIDQVYILYLQKIGNTHYRIGLGPEWFLAGINVYLDEMNVLCKPLEKGLDTYHAFSKRILFDAMVCLGQYHRLKAKK